MLKGSQIERAYGNSIQLGDQVSHERIHVRSVTLLSGSGCVATKRETIVCPENAGVGHYLSLVDQLGLEGYVCAAYTITRKNSNL